MLAHQFMRLAPRSRPGSLAVAALVLGAACSPRPSAVAPPSEPAAPEVQAPCATAEACMTEAVRANEAGELVRAREYFGFACDRGDANGCNESGVMLERDSPLRAARFRSACDLDDAFGCVNLGSVTTDPREAIGASVKGCDLDVKVCDVAARVVIDAEDWTRARALAERGCTDAVDVACGTLGSLLLKGLGGPQDSPRGAVALERGCKAGDTNACENWEFYRSVVSADGAAAAGDLTVPNASLRMGSVSADGYTIRDLACKLDDGGLNVLMVGPMLAAAIGSRRAALKKCAPKGGEARVLFNMSGGKTEARAKAVTPAVVACVVKVMTTVEAVSEGLCAVTIDLRQ
ncbi:MAG TPA: hypothetical protein VGB85_12000 [Nannocystis sp.]